jgi:soluble lytic murein transglycosylase
LLLTTAGPVLGDPSAADTGPRGSREAFLAAERALARGDVDAFEALGEGLRDYPLYPYLRFETLKRRLDRASSAEVEAFLTEHGDTPLAGRIRLAWLDRLAARGAWADYARLYVPDDSAERRCRYLQALLETGRGTEALDQVEPLWLVGRSQPPACDPVFDAWRLAGGMTTELVWERIAAAFAAGETGLARYLGGLLPPEESPWLRRWLRIHAEPERIDDPLLLPQAHPWRSHILVHGIERLARRSRDAAANAWGRIAAREALPGDLAVRAEAAVGLALAEAGDLRGLPYLSRVPAGEDNLDFQERRLRTALRLGAWEQVAAWVEAMPEGERKTEHWLYWQARALEALGDQGAAAPIYARAAGERSMWGFLAAERLGVPYRLDHRRTPVPEARVARLSESPAGRRIRELRALERSLDVRREWRHLRRRLEGDELKAAAVLAQRWDAPDQSIFTLTRTGYWDDLVLRFPLLHRDLVRAGADANGLDEPFVYAVLRQESAFDPGAVSHAGALGLMQLMPATAHAMARALDLPVAGRSALLVPETNIALGSGYLARMKDRYGQHPALAAAAYNAGPGRVDAWLPARPMDADVWIATIPFRETRGYVRRVLAYRLIYAWRLGQASTPLVLMPPVGQGALTEAGTPRPERIGG